MLRISQRTVIQTPRRVGWLVARLTVCLVVLLNLGLLAWSQPNVLAANPAQLLYIKSDGNLTLVNADGSGERILAPSVFYAKWSPDGNKIAYVSSIPDANYSHPATIINADGSNPRKLEGSADSDTASFRWSPDSQRLAYSTGDRLIIVNADGTNAVKVTSADGKYIDDPFWSPGNDYLIYGTLSTEPGMGMGSTMPMDVYTVKANGSNQRKLFNIAMGEIAGFWVDGQRLILNETEMNMTDPNSGSEWHLTVVNQDGSNKQVLPKKQPLDLQVATLSPDGSKVLLGVSSPVVVDASNPTNGKEIAFADTFVAAAIWSKTPGKVLAVLSSGTNFSLEEIDVTSLERRVIADALPAAPVGQITTDSLPFSNFALEPGGRVLMTDSAGTVIVVDTASGAVNTLTGQGITVSGSWRPSGVSNGPTPAPTPAPTPPTTYGSILPDFYNVWKLSDLALASGKSNKSWLWGPDAFSTKTEDYKEAKDSKRQVQYFDKARMEINNPDGNRSNAYFVTNGLLPKELIGGYIQSGDSENQPKTPAEVNVAGDPDGSITYAKLAGVVTLEPGKNTASDKSGQKVTASIDRSGKVSDGTALEGVTLAQFVPETGHNLPNVFVEYFKTLPQDWLFVMGYPISEPYQTEITLAGKSTQVLIQVFERRVLTYTPSNADPFKVEQGNVGRHYYQWRYGN
jgi:hypothetical protein